MPPVNREVLRSHRQQTGLKVTQLAERCGVAMKTLANAESTGSGLSMEALYRIVDQLGRLLGVELQIQEFIADAGNRPGGPKSPPNGPPDNRPPKDEPKMPQPSDPKDDPKKIGAVA